MGDRIVRLGIIWPTGGGEYEYFQYARATGETLRVYLVTSRVGGEEGKDHDIDALKQTARCDWLCEAAGRLAVLEPDVAFWACTSGSFVLGRDYAERQRDAIAEAAGVPAGSTSLAFAKVLEETGIRRVSVLATYPEPAARAFSAFLAEFGVDVAHLQWLDAPSGWHASAFDPEIVVDGVRQAAIDGADAVLVPDTALPTLSLVDRLEAAAARPVLTANAVSLWNAMALAGEGIPVPGYGSLLAGRLGAGEGAAAEA